MSVLHVIAYDIPDDRRRNRVARVLEGFGERVQDSVFECWLDARRYRSLVTRLSARIDTHTDKVRIYPLCGKDVADVLTAGAGHPPVDKDVPVI
ncbi:MAG: CRISPR-associated endonuclease Cas2 [Tepidimonas taiwanensis]|nr:CRISPR-associated endonuclease Cas2 [Tepidimonas taiwanensis]